MMIGLGECPTCQGKIAYAAIACPHCGHHFGSYGNFAGYQQAEDARIAIEAVRMAEEERRRKQASCLRRIVTFLVIAVLIAVVALFYYWNTTQASPPSPTSPPSPAEATVQQYYDDINNQNYQDASTLWYPQKALASLEKGYAYTLHDDLTIGSVESQPDGTVKVSVTVVATEKTSSGGTRQTTYTGYYIVGQHDGVWKLLDGKLNPV